MNYVSTRGLVNQSNMKSFSEVTLEGLAPDGGLYLPLSIPKFSELEINKLSDLSYVDLCAKIISYYTDEYFTEDDIKTMAFESYKNFDTDDVAPLNYLDNNKYILELFHGPTLAFKDFALQLLSKVFESIIERDQTNINIIGATSGDTGSSAIKAFKNNKNTNIFILHPKNKVSEFQRRQMTTVSSSNVYNIAIEGNFDDCQALVKSLLVDKEFKNKYKLSSINSINWCRVLAQVVYYFYAAFKLKNHSNIINFSVPTGNFGDAYAGYIAKKMGLPIGKIIIATNSNDILARFFQTGEYRTADVVPTLSPSMDIQVASNFERLLFEMLDYDYNLVKDYMKNLKEDGYFKINSNELINYNKTFIGVSVDDNDTLNCMRNVYENYDLIIDPHTSVGIQATNYNNLKLDEPTIILSTAHAVKFSAAVQKAIGDKSDFSSIYKNLFDLKENYTDLNNDLTNLKNYISDKIIN